MKLPEKNIMIDHYLQELHVLSSEILRIYDEIEKIINSHRPGMPGVMSMVPNKYFFIRPEVFTRIANIQVHSANIKKILFLTPRKQKEAKYKYQYKEQRVSELQKYFDLENLTEIRNAEARNSLEHYDERLDNISLRLWNGTIDKKYHIIASNIIISKDGALAGNPYYLNCYIIDSKVFKTAEKESNIGKLVQEAKHILSITNEHGIETQSGSVIPIPQNLDKNK